jgi:hypothetical protein
MGASSGFHCDRHSTSLYHTAALALRAGALSIDTNGSLAKRPHRLDRRRCGRATGQEVDCAAINVRNSGRNPRSSIPGEGARNGAPQRATDRAFLKHLQQSIGQLRNIFLFIVFGVITAKKTGAWAAAGEGTGCRIGDLGVTSFRGGKSVIAALKTHSF